MSLSGSSLGWMQNGRTPADVARSGRRDEAVRLLDSWRGPSQVRAIPHQLHPDLPYHCGYDSSMNKCNCLLSFLLCMYLAAGSTSGCGSCSGGEGRCSGGEGCCSVGQANNIPCLSREICLSVLPKSFPLTRCLLTLNAIIYA